MKEHDIVAKVREIAGLEDNDHAAAATRATLEVLAQRLAGREPHDLAAQLPPAIAEALPDTGSGEEFGLGEFYRRVAAAEGRDCTLDGAREHARAVVAVIRQTVTEGELDDLVAQLPQEYRHDLLATAPVHEQRRT
ncbi:Uncharacterized conserved protein, DUF2267 family [Amycolatopsis arida]|uniref:Uncharacterized conserved protein, DUF2267 family n=1 Tax=Amycolatopsis arida TaxID=587909 RepID=A0A1I6A9K8_9PSEU|nr:DUF2267 domain-containing protein [Amycolatopsis arida]TDX88494.1 uncharacterized protein (DUF2267 family) [Amycolatopsis arida]SFQ65369.1 Uncharacterized conserved protein, DUF2267 family [Amycolatopsis arida]